jgi:hypothetical protein
LTADQLALRIASINSGAVADVQQILDPKPKDEKTKDRERKAKQRASGRELYIPPPVNVERRNACLANPELLLTTYFPATYYEPFTEDRRDMLRSIDRAATYGGDQAIAGSRGEGKTTLAIDGALCLMLSGKSTFPVVIGKNQDASSDELKALRERILGSDSFCEDFPEIAVPLRSVGPSTANARLLTVGGKFIGMYLGVKHFAFPKIPNDLLPDWPPGVKSVACGQIMGACGIDGQVRGFKFRSHRPTLAIIDDVEDKDSVRSDDQIQKIENIIEEDIGGMGSSAEQIARVYLCTTLNRKCNAYKYTDPKQKPSWNGRRYRKMLQKPDRMDLVETYIEMRQLRKPDDPDAREAFRFWQANKEEIERGAVVSNQYSYSKKIHEDGQPMELSAVQAYFNRVADRGAKAVATEIDNDPPEEAGPQNMGLTAEIVASQLSGLVRRQVPAHAEFITAGIDIGKYACHWTVCAWWAGAGGVVIDYGIAEVSGNENVRHKDRATDMEASEPAIYRALLAWRDYLLNTRYIDAGGVERKVNMVLCDSGTYTNAVYEFCRQVRGIFRPSKGIANYHARRQSSETCIAAEHQHAQWIDPAKVWLQELDTDHWKQWVHERFLTPCFDENNMLRRGSLSLYQPEGSRRHLSFAQHITAEELTNEFIVGKGSVEKWLRKSPNNHWLDATYLAAACTEALGCNLISPSEIHLQATQMQPKQPKAVPANQMRQQHGQRFKVRPGGWVPKRR